MTNLSLTDEQAALFILFQQNYDNFAFLLSQGVFDTRQGSVQLNFSREGLIHSLDWRSHTTRGNDSLL